METTCVQIAATATPIFSSQSTLLSGLHGPVLLSSASQICLQNLCGQQQNSPMADPTFGPKSGPQNGAQERPKRRNENVIQFWTLFGPKNGVSHRRISLLPTHVVQADLRPCSLLPWQVSLGLLRPVFVMVQQWEKLPLGWVSCSGGSRVRGRSV